MNDAGIDPSKWQAGKTKLFLKEPSTVSFLDSQQETTHGSFVFSHVKGKRALFMNKDRY